MILEKLFRENDFTKFSQKIRENDFTKIFTKNLVKWISFSRKIALFVHFLAQFASSNFLAELEQRQQQLYSVEKGSVRER